LATTTDRPDGKPSSNALVLLAAISAAQALLAVWQWMELIVVQAGGKPVCSVNETVDCARVWQSDFSHRVHELTGLPIAGLGLEWALAALGLSLWLTHRTLSGADTKPLELGVKVWAALGALSCVTFGVASARLGTVCPSCLLTYLVTFAYAAVAFGMLPAPRWPDTGLLLKALPRALALALPLHVALLYPAARTPKPAKLTAGAGLTDAQVMEYFEHLAPMEAQATADARAAWLKAEVPDFVPPPTRARWGPADAPVKIVEFTDVLCGHCRQLVAMLNKLKEAVPEGHLSIEPRYFPLDGECNSIVGQPKGDGVRCLGAKLQLCLEGRPELWAVRDALFENQATLNVEKIWELAAEHGVKKADVQACIASPETAEKLAADVAYAMAYNISGTPLVLVNGKETMGLGPFLLGLAMSKGDPHSKYFSKLPPSR